MSYRLPCELHFQNVKTSAHRLILSATKKVASSVAWPLKSTLDDDGQHIAVLQLMVKPTRWSSNFALGPRIRAKRNFLTKSR